jgi:hypothetical protein
VTRAGVALLSISASISACTDDHGPRLAAAAPASAPAGALVTISGERLCGESGDCEAAGGAIRIGYDNPVQAMILAYTDTSAQIRIPSITPIGDTVLIVTVNERASNALDFRVLAP